MPEDKKFMLKTAYSYFQNSQWDRALDEYSKLLRLDPKDHNIHQMVADIHARKGAVSEAVAGYLKAAAILDEQGLLEKEITTFRRILKLEPSHVEALQKGKAAIRRRVGQLKDGMEKAGLDATEADCRRLLEFDPANFEAHKLLDELAALRLQQQAQPSEAKAMELLPSEALAKEGPGPAHEPLPAADPTLELVAKLSELAESYLLADDLENAAESLITVLKLKPDQLAAANRLQEVRLMAEKREAAHQVWHKVETREERGVEEARRAKSDAEALARWQEEEARAREAMRAEVEAAERDAGMETAIVERAALEMRQRLESGQAAPPPPVDDPMVEDTIFADPSASPGAGASAGHVPPSGQVASPGDREARLEAEAAALRHETEMLRHQMELTRLEAEAKAREAASQELTLRIEQERREMEARMAAERELQSRREEEFRRQMEELMRVQAEKLEQEVKQKALAELKAQMESQAKASGQAQAEAQARQEANLKALEAQRQAQAEAQNKIRSERDLVQALQSEQEAQKRALHQRAMQMRETRQEGQKEERAQIMKSSRKISDAIRAAATKHLEQDLSAMINTAHSYVRQDLLTDAMRICQKIVEQDPQNPEATAILKEIFQKKGL